VISRGNGRRDIFLSNDDRYLFLELLEQLSERFDVELYAYVLMGNHYHLLLKTLESNLSRAMQWFGTAFTRKFDLLWETGRLSNREVGTQFGLTYSAISRQAKLIRERIEKET